MTITERLLNKYAIVILMIFWLMVQFALFLRYGFVMDFEGLKYQNDANLLTQHFQFNFQRIFYSSYTIIIAAILKLGLGYYGVLIFQLIINAWSNVMFFKILKRSLSQSVAFIISVLLILTVQIQMWNFHLFTESLFISGIIIFMYIVFSFNYSLKDIIKLLLLLVFISYLRPIGISLALPAIVYFIAKNDDDKKQRFIIISILVLLVVLQFVLMLLLKDNFNEFYTVATAKLWIIGAYDTISDYPQFSFLPDYIRAIVLRFLYYFSMLRPYYSNIHNLLEMFFYPIYLLSFIGMYSMYKNNLSKLLFILSIIGIFTVFTVFTHVNYHGRYISPILPIFLMSASFGLDFLRTKFYS